MTEEIKEILNILNTMAKENKESDNPLQATVILFEILYRVLDYITNLQQEINKLTAESTEWESKYYDLQQENEFLKLNNPEQNMEHFRIIKENKRKIDNLRKENKKLKECYCNRTDCSGRIKDSKKYDSLKQRIDKAIEEINYWGIDKEHNDNSAMRLALGNILNILIGSDEK